MSNYDQFAFMMESQAKTLSMLANDIRNGVAKDISEMKSSINKIRSEYDEKIDDIKEMFVDFQNRICINREQQNSLYDKVHRKAHELCLEKNKPAQKHNSVTLKIYKSVLNPSLGVRSYKEIRAKDYEIASQIIDNINWETLYPECSQINMN